MIFSTERLIVRKLVFSDLDAFHKMQSNPNVMRYTGDSVKTLEENRINLEEVIACYTKTGNEFWVWAIDRKSDGEFIGTCAFSKLDPRQLDPNEDEIGFRFLEKYWGNGYASEMMAAMIDYAFTELGKTELMAEVDELNIASVKILEKQMTFVSAYYSEVYKSNDRKYVIKKHP